MIEVEEDEKEEHTFIHSYIKTTSHMIWPHMSSPLWIECIRVMFNALVTCSNKIYIQSHVWSLEHLFVHLLQKDQL